MGAAVQASLGESAGSHVAFGALSAAQTSSPFISDTTESFDDEAGCLEDQVLAAFVAGELRNAELPQVETHIARCERCLEVVTYVLLGLDEEPAAHAAMGSPYGPVGRIGERFEVGFLIAKGGMGRVYEGRDTQTGERVAIKCLRPSVLEGHPSSPARLAREGVILSQLHHPNVVRLIAIVDEGGQKHLVMEYVAGGTLRDTLTAERRLPTERALQITLEVAHALSAAHRMGVVHRDLKPENVLLADNGSVRVIDFGLAGRLRSNLTQGKILGTLAYISPEGLCEHPADERSDVWALGVMLFEMLVGSRPFYGASASALVTAILHDPLAPLNVLLPQAPGRLIELLGAMLEKDHERRIARAQDVATHIEAICRASRHAGRQP